MTESTADEVMYGWVQDLGYDLWFGAPIVFVPRAKMVPTKDLISMHRLLRLAKVKPENVKDKILVVHADGQFLIRDGHYQFAIACFANKTLIEVQMIETDDEVPATGHTHSEIEACGPWCGKFEKKDESGSGQTDNPG